MSRKSFVNVAHDIFVGGIQCQGSLL